MYIEECRVVIASGAFSSYSPGRTNVKSDRPPTFPHAEGDENRNVMLRCFASRSALSTMRTTATNNKHVDGVSSRCVRSSVLSTEEVQLRFFLMRESS